MRVTDIPIEEIEQIGGLKAVKELLRAQREEEEADAQWEQHLEDERAEELAIFFATCGDDEDEDPDEFDPYDYAGTCERMKLTAKNEEQQAHNELTESLMQLCEDAQEFGSLAYEDKHSTESGDFVELAAYFNTVAESFNTVLAAFQEYHRAEEFKQIANKIAEVSE